jgi:hypothetical protein
MKTPTPKTMRDGIQSLNSALRKAVDADPDNADLRYALRENNRNWLWYTEMDRIVRPNEYRDSKAKRGTPEMQAAARAAVAAMRGYPTE